MPNSSSATSGVAHTHRKDGRLKTNESRSTAAKQTEQDTVAERLSELLELLEPDLHDAVRSADTGRELRELAGRISSVLPRDDPTAEVIGPVYETADLVSWLGITRQALHKRVQRHDVLALKTGDGYTIYPAWQFDADGKVRPGVATSTRELARVMDDWMRALWFAGATPELEELSAAQWLSEGRDPATVISAAKRTAGRMAR